MTIGGVDTLDYGLVPITVSGAHDMPSRISPYQYDWGDEIQPIFSPSQMAWEGRTITVRFLFDRRRATVENRIVPNLLDVVTRNWEQANTMVLVLSQATGAIGSYTGRISAMTGHKRSRGDFATINMVFQEHIPAFPGTVPTPPGTAPDISLGGHGFGAFGITVSRPVDLSALGAAKESSATRYMKSADVGPYRALQGVKISCNCIGDTPQDLLVNISNFQKLLTTPSLLDFTYPGWAFKAFVPTGFKGTVRSGRALKFDLTIYRYEDI